MFKIILKNKNKYKTKQKINLNVFFNFSLMYESSWASPSLGSFLKKFNNN